MEWVETTGRTVAEAVEQALERLGVAQVDAEVIVLEEPRSLMFGLKKTDARVRARVRPTEARAKRPARRKPDPGAARSRSTGPSGRSRSNSKAVAEQSESPASLPRRSQPKRERIREQPAPARGQHRSRDGATSAMSEDETAHDGHRNRSRRRSPSQDQAAGAGAEFAGIQRATGSDADHKRGPRGPRGPRGDGPHSRDRIEEEEMSVESQAELAEKFVRGVVDGFGLTATVVSSVEDDRISVTVEGDGLGLLIGSRGATIEALQELTRTVVQARSDEHSSRVNVDVGGFRLRRAEALAQFAVRTAKEVLVSGDARALEPMGAADRKIVHDAVNGVEGASTTSEGEDPRRYVVIRRLAIATEDIPAIHDETASPDD